MAQRYKVLIPLLLCYSRMSELKGRSHTPLNQPVTRSSSRGGGTNAITPESVALHNQEQTSEEETLLTQLVVTALQKKDLGQSGYVTLTELSSALTADTFKVQHYFTVIMD